jgi:hypothetical protein
VYKQRQKKPKACWRESLLRKTILIFSTLCGRAGEVEEAAKEDVLPFDIPYISERDLITPMPPVSRSVTS